MASTNAGNLKKKPINRNNNKKNCTNKQERLSFNDERRSILNDWNKSDKTQTAVGRSNTKRSCQSSNSMNRRQSKCEDFEVVVESFRGIPSRSSSSESSLESLNDAAVSESVTASSRALGRYTVCPRVQWRRTTTIQRNRKTTTTTTAAAAKETRHVVKRRHKETSASGACRHRHCRLTANSPFDRHSFPTNHSPRSSGLHRPECRRHRQHHARQFPNHRRRTNIHGSDATMDTLFGLEEGASKFTSYFDQSVPDLSRVPAAELTSCDRGLCRSKFLPAFDPPFRFNSDTEVVHRCCRSCGNRKRGNYSGFSDRLGCLASFDEKPAENESFICRDKADAAAFCCLSDLNRWTPCGNRCRLRANDYNYKIESSLFDSSIDAASAAYPRGTTARSSNNAGVCTAGRYTFSGDVGLSSRCASPSGPKSFNIGDEVASMPKGDSKKRQSVARLVSEDLSKSLPNENRDFEFENRSYDDCSGRCPPINRRKCQDVMTGLRRRIDETDRVEELGEYADQTVLGKSRNRMKPSAIFGANKDLIRPSNDETDCLDGRSIAVEKASTGKSLGGKTPPDFANESSADGNKHRLTTDSPEKKLSDNSATLESASSSAKTGLEREFPTPPPAVGKNRKGRLKKRYKLFTSETRSTETIDHLKTSIIGDTIREVDEIHGTDYQEINSKTAAAAAAKVHLRDEAIENKIEDVGQHRKDASLTSINQTSLSSSLVRQFFTADEAVAAAAAAAAAADRRVQEVYFAESRKIAEPNRISLLPSSKEISSRCLATASNFEDLLFLPYSLTLVTEDNYSFSASSFSASSFSAASSLQQRLVLAPTKLRLDAGFHHHQSSCPGDEEEEEEAAANQERSASAELELQTSNQGVSIGSRTTPETENECKREQTGKLRQMYATNSPSSSSAGMQTQKETRNQRASVGFLPGKQTRTDEVGSTAPSQFNQGEPEDVSPQSISQESGKIEGKRILLDYIWTSVASQMNPGDRNERGYAKIQEEQGLANPNLTVESDQSTISPSRLCIALPMLETACESPDKQLQQQQQACLEIQPDGKQQHALSVIERSVLVLSAQRNSTDAAARPAVVFRPENASPQPPDLVCPHYKAGDQCLDASESLFRDELMYCEIHCEITNRAGKKSIYKAVGLNADMEMSTFNHDATDTETSNAEMDDSNETQSSQPSVEDANQVQVTISVTKTRPSSIAQVEGKRQASKKQSNSKAVKEITSVLPTSVRAKHARNAAATTTTAAIHSPSPPSKQRSTPRKRPALNPQHSTRSSSQVTGTKDTPATPPQPDSPKPENRHSISTTTTTTRHAKSTTSFPQNRDTSTGRRPRPSSMQRDVETGKSASRILALSRRRDPTAETSDDRRRPVAILPTASARRLRPRHDKSTQVAAGSTVADKAQMTEQGPTSSDKSTQISRHSPTVDGTSQTDQQTKQADKSVQSVQAVEQKPLVDQCMRTARTPEARPVVIVNSATVSSAAFCYSTVPTTTTNCPQLDEIFFIDEGGVVVVSGPKGDLSKQRDSDRDGEDEETVYSFSECKRLIVNLERSVRKKVEQLASNRTQQHAIWIEEKLNDDDDDDRNRPHEPFVDGPTTLPPESPRKAEARVLLLDPTAAAVLMVGSGASELSEKKAIDERQAPPPPHREWERSIPGAIPALVPVLTKDVELTDVAPSNGRVSFNEEVEVQFIDEDSDDGGDGTSFSDDDGTGESDCTAD